MVSFRIAEHTSGTSQVVEVWHDGQLIATIYGRESNGRHAEVSLISKRGVDVREEVTHRSTVLPSLHCVYIQIAPLQL